MAEHPYTDLSPADAAVALRSFERRFREAAKAAVVSLDDEPDQADIDEVATRPGADGRSALDHVVAARRRIADALPAVQKALVSPDSVVEPRLLDLEPAAAAATSSSDQSSSLATEVQRLAVDAAALAERVESADAGHWTGVRSTTTGGTTTPLAIVQTTVAFAIDTLKSVDRVLREVRGRP